MAKNKRKRKRKKRAITFMLFFFLPFIHPITTFSFEKIKIFYFI